jgi:hypothetical protein
MLCYSTYAPKCAEIFKADSEACYMKKGGFHMSNKVDTKNKRIEVKQDAVIDVEESNEEIDAVSIWETSRRRSRHSRQSAAQARIQGKRRQLRRLWGRNR